MDGRTGLSRSGSRGDQRGFGHREAAGTMNASRICMQRYSWRGPDDRAGRRDRDVDGNAVRRAQEAPWGLVSWRPVAGNPVFTGTGSDTWDRKIRERGWILVGRDGVFHLWYTGYDRDQPETMSLGHATSPDGLHWTRDPNNPIFRQSWVEDMCVVLQDGTYQMFAEGRNDIAHRLSSTDGLHWTDHGSLDIRRDRRCADLARILRHAGRLVREGNLVPLLRARRPGSLAGHIARPQDLDQRQG